MTLRDFNYGRPLQEKPPIYLAGMKLARRLSQEALRASQQAWALEMALWKVRIATTGEEKAIAVQALIKGDGEMDINTKILRDLLDRRDEIDAEMASMFTGTKERKAQRCSRCQQEGHSARTCPQKE